MGEEGEQQRWWNDSLLCFLSLFTASEISDLMIVIQQEQKWFIARASFTGKHELWYRMGLYTAQFEHADNLFTMFGKGPSNQDFPSIKINK